MIEIALAVIPNQAFSIRLDNQVYDVTLKETDGVMSATIVRDGVTILSGTRVVAGTPLIPYEYLESGNFMLLTDDDDLPDYTKFGISQSLIYASQAELEALRAGT